MRMDPLVYIVDSDKEMRESLLWLIESVKLKAKACSTMQEFFTEYDHLQHSCILMDVRMFKMSSTQVQETLCYDGKALPVIFISGSVDVPIIVKLVKNGAIDFFLRPFDDKTLLDSIDKALAYDKDMRIKQQENQDYKERISQLSSREMQILHGVLASEQNKQISTKLNISLKTVEAHRASMMKKLEVNSVVDLIKLVVSKGY